MRMPTIRRSFLIAASAGLLGTVALFTAPASNAAEDPACSADVAPIDGQGGQLRLATEAGCDGSGSYLLSFYIEAEDPFGPGGRDVHHAADFQMDPRTKAYLAHVDCPPLSPRAGRIRAVVQIHDQADPNVDVPLFEGPWTDRPDSC